ncbi:putative ubiquitin-conjugating enzyme/RWD [Helianthus anomalus]
MYYILNVIYIGYQLHTLSKISTSLLQKELMEWHVNPLAKFRDKVTDNELKVMIFCFAMLAGQVIFVPPAPLHPHIYSNCHLCLGLFHDSSVHKFSKPLA